MDDFSEFFDNLWVQRCIKVLITILVAFLIYNIIVKKVYEVRKISIY